MNKVKPLLDEQIRETEPTLETATKSNAPELKSDGQGKSDLEEKWVQKYLLRMPGESRGHDESEVKNASWKEKFHKKFHNAIVNTHRSDAKEIADALKGLTANIERENKPMKIDQALRKEFVEHRDGMTLNREGWTKIFNKYREVAGGALSASSSSASSLSHTVSPKEEESEEDEDEVNEVR
jgi:hypothetical protein